MTTSLGYVMPPQQLAQKNVRTFPQNKPNTWGRLADSNWRAYALRVL
ncbi:MAG: hypothetical protein OR995_08960 [Candidatus Nanopelagicales bacterium]|nr:hypothetical protein [Candidatus Nanopelagicales bacterium]